ncbi:unnamed protein product, partial [Mesorhabditis belari]|uniref:SXP/RAL-2 family protein Ani s 5-like cation-binding domain-containing protein n=1 Tax=Mesorhabditis belari TaxID=2138241 RepID=A0AAF3EZJ9_9BILA
MKSSDAIFLLIISFVSSFNLDEVVTNLGVPQLFEEAMLNRDPECGLPFYTNSLPLLYRRNLRKIWANFPLGSKSCSVELRQTQSILDSLPSDLRQKALRSKSWSPATATLLPGTPFLASLSNSQQKELSKIASDGSLSETERVVMLKAWAVEHLEPNAQARFEQTLRFLSAKANRFQEKVAAMSAEARMALNRLDDLRRQKISILNRLSFTAKRELAILWKPKCNSSEGVDPDVFLIACSNKGTMAVTEKPTTPLISEHSTLMPSSPMNNISSTSTIPTTYENKVTIKIGTEKEPIEKEETSTRKVSTIGGETGEETDETTQMVSPEIEIFRRHRPDQISSLYNIVSKEAAIDERRVS